MPAWLERRQIPVYLAALAAGAAAGLAAPAAAPALEAAVYPVLGALLYATFAQVPFSQFTSALRDVRFLSATLTLNFIAVPVVVAALTAFAPLPPAVLLGVLLTLLTPCIDYVIVFTRLAGGDHRRLLAASPLLMAAQMVLLAPLLWLFVGPSLADAVEPGPFLEAFGLLIALPLALAWATQRAAARHRPARRVLAATDTAMVPLMAATLFVVVAGQIPGVRGELGHVAAAAPIYAAFGAVMAFVALAAAKAFGLDPPRARALVFSAVTRNSLVVLPIALALPQAYAITPVIVVTQTLVELLIMVVFVSAVPRLLPQRATT